MNQGPSVDPLFAGMPAFHRRGIENLLAHELHLVEDDLKTRLGFGPIANQAESANDSFDWALDPGKPGVLEGVRVEKHPQHRAYVVSRPEIFILQQLDGFKVSRRRTHPRWHLHVVGDEVAVQVAGYEPCRGWLFDDDVDDIFAIEVPGLAEECFLSVIVIVRIVNELCVVAAVGLVGD